MLFFKRKKRLECIDAEQRFFELHRKAGLGRSIPSDLDVSFLDLTNYHVSKPNELYCVIRNYTDKSYRFDMNGIYSHEGTCYSIKRTQFEIQPLAVEVFVMKLGDKVERSSFGDLSAIASSLNTCKLNIKSNAFLRHSDWSTVNVAYEYVECDRKKV